MKTISELANAAVLLHVNDMQTPFIILTDRYCTVSGNVLGNYSFQVRNDAEVYMHIANPAIIPNANLGKIRVVCCGENYSMDSIICLPAKVYVLPKERFLAEKINGSFSSVKAWMTLKTKLDVEASNNVAKTEGHPKLSIETTSHPGPTNTVNTNEYSCGSTLEYLENNG